MDAVVLAVGAKGMNALMAQSSRCADAPELVAAGTLGAIDVVSVRLWLDRYVAVADPANVLSLCGVAGAGATFFMLDQLQRGNETELWGGETPQGSVIASDFYNATAIAELSDAAIVEVLMRELLPLAQPAVGDAQVVDWGGAPVSGSVSLFSPGSFQQRPPLETSIPWWCVPATGCEWATGNTVPRVYARNGLLAYVCGLRPPIHCCSAGS